MKLLICALIGHRRRGELFVEFKDALIALDLIRCERCKHWREPR